MPEILCPDCGKRLFHENEDTLKIEENIHKKFCRKKDGEHQSYMHREKLGENPFDPERENDAKGQPVLKR